GVRCKNKKRRPVKAAFSFFRTRRDYWQVVFEFDVEPSSVLVCTVCFVQSTPPPFVCVVVRVWLPNRPILLCSTVVEVAGGSTTTAAGGATGTTTVAGRSSIILVCA